MSLGDSFEEKRNPMGQPEGVNVLGRMVSSSFGGGGGGLASEGKFMDMVYFMRLRSLLALRAGVISFTCCLLEL